MRSRCPNYLAVQTLVKQALLHSCDSIDLNHLDRLPPRERLPLARKRLYPRRRHAARRRSRSWSSHRGRSSWDRRWPSPRASREGVTIPDACERHGGRARSGGFGGFCGGTGWRTQIVEAEEEVTEGEVESCWDLASSDLGIGGDDARLAGGEEGISSSSSEESATGAHSVLMILLSASTADRKSVV